MGLPLPQLITDKYQNHQILSGKTTIVTLLWCTIQPMHMNVKIVCMYCCWVLYEAANIINCIQSTFYWTINCIHITMADTEAAFKYKFSMQYVPS